MQREAMLRNIRERREPWDIAVIGGGATGVGVAVDAASRGLDVVLVRHTTLAKAQAAAAPNSCTGECAISNRAMWRW